MCENLERTRSRFVCSPYHRKIFDQSCKRFTTTVIYLLLCFLVAILLIFRKNIHKIFIFIYSFWMSSLTTRNMFYLDVVKYCTRKRTFKFQIFKVQQRFIKLCTIYIQYYLVLPIDFLSVFVYKSNNQLQDYDILCTSI